MLLRALIVDDEPLAREGVRMLLGQEPGFAEIHEARDGAEALRLIRDEKPHIVFLDVQMPEMDGFSVLREVGVANLPAIVFVSAYDRYALDAFEVSAVDYLLKPVNRERFSRCVARARSRVHAGSDPALNARMVALLETVTARPQWLDRFAVKEPGGTVLVEAADVDWIEAAENYVELHTGGAPRLVHTTMNALAQKLDPAVFLRVHRSLIVNVKSIKRLDDGFHGEYLLTMRCGRQLRTGRTYRDQVRRLFSN